MKRNDFDKLDEDIIVRLHNKDEEAFAIIYKFYYKRIYNLAYRCFHEAHTAEDMVQNTFLVLYQYLDKITSVQALTIWVNKIAYQRCMQELRKKQVMVIPEDENMMESMEDPNISNDIIETLGQKDLYKQIEKSLMQMDEKLKIVGILRFYEDLTTKEISEIMNIPEGTVKSRLHQIKKILKGQIKGYEYQKFRIGAVHILGILFSIKLLAKIIIMNSYKIKATMNVAMIASIVTVSVSLAAMYSRSQKIDSYIKVTYNTDYTNKPIDINIDTSFKYDKLLINGEAKTKIEKNGIYKISLLTKKDTIEYGEIHIDNIDNQSPVLLREEKEGDTIYLYLSEKDSGMSKESISYVVNNEISSAFTYDEQNQTIIFQSKDGELSVFTIQDRAGNAIEITIST